MPKKVIISESILKGFVREILNEISSADAWKRFYEGKIQPELYNLLMSGSTQMTPLHKTALDIIIKDMERNDEEGAGFYERIASTISVLWNTKGLDARKYAIDHIPKWINTDGYGCRYFYEYLESVVKMRSHTENGWANGGYHVLFSNEKWNLTCTTSYSASKKYYGESHWCTASGIEGEYNGFEMFQYYTGNGDDSDCEPSALFQFVDKQDNSFTTQMQVDRYEKIGDVCLFNGHSIDPEKVYEHFGIKSIMDVIDNFTLQKLIDETYLNQREEFAYWEKKKILVFENFAKKFNEGVDSGVYDGPVLEMIKYAMAHRESHIGTHYPPTGDTIWCDGKIEDRFGDFILFSVTLKGYNKDEKDFFYNHEDNYNFEAYCWPLMKNRQVWFLNKDATQILKKVVGEVDMVFDRSVLIRCEEEGSYFYKEVLVSKETLESTSKIIPTVSMSGFNSPTGTTENGDRVLYIMEPVRGSDKYNVGMISIDTLKYLGKDDNNKWRNKLIGGARLA